MFLIIGDVSGTVECHSWAASRGISFTAVLLIAVFACSLEYQFFGPVRASSSSPTQTGTVLSVRKVLNSTSHVSARYSPAHRFDIYFRVRVAEQTYCEDYQTVVLDEIEDLVSCNGREVAVALSADKKAIIVYTPRNRRLKAHAVNGRNCSSVASSR